jgi:hypothetical protein
MTAATVAQPLPKARRRHQELVSALLDEVEERRQQLYVLQASGVRPAALRDLKADLRAVRHRLAEAVDRR